MNIFSILHPKSEIKYLKEDDTLRQGLEKMHAHGYTAIPVIDKEGHYVGSVSEGDFLWYILESGYTNLKQFEQTSLKELIRPEWMPAVSIYVSREELLQHAMNQNYIPVVDDRNIFIGIITRRDIISWTITENNTAHA